jgi:hypothetical protein
MEHKNKKIMCWEKFKNEICVEVNAMDEEGTEVIIRKVIGDIGIHETYMNIYNKLMNMSENVKWEIHYVCSRSINSIYNNETKEKGV